MKCEQEKGKGKKKNPVQTAKRDEENPYLYLNYNNHDYTDVNVMIILTAAMWEAAIDVTMRKKMILEKKQFNFEHKSRVKRKIIVIVTFQFRENPL